MILVLIFLLMLINLIMALSVFVLIARPEKMMFFLTYLGGNQAKWEQGLVDEQEEQRLLLMAKRLQSVGLLILFACSFLCGALISYLQLLDM